MTQLRADEIYRVAREAGFDPSQAATMTAIALAESSGDPEAHNGSGEDSWGLWQINLAVHDDLRPLGDPTDPLANARMAFAVSAQGADITPWTVTHGGEGARYLAYRAEAERAAQRVEPGVAVHGMWSGTSGYFSDPVPASTPVPGGYQHPVDPPVWPAGGAGSSPGVASGDEFLAVATSQVGHQLITTDRTSLFLTAALDQRGDSYVFGAEAAASDLDPDQFDCSELVQWAAAQAGIEVGDGSWIQYQQVRAGGSELTVEEALRTPGALLFRFGSDPLGGGRPTGAHVAISLGDGRTIEARGAAYGVDVFDATGRGWTHAGYLPGLTTATSAPLVIGPLDTMADSDGDGILDVIERAIGTDPFDADTDRDGFIDSVEVVVYRTAPRDASDNARVLTIVDAGHAAPPLPPPPPRPEIFDEPVTPGVVAPPVVPVVPVVPEAVAPPVEPVVAAPVEQPVEPVAPGDGGLSAQPLFTGLDDADDFDDPLGDPLDDGALLTPDPLADPRDHGDRPDGADQLDDEL